MRQPKQEEQTMKTRRKPMKKQEWNIPATVKTGADTGIQTQPSDILKYSTIRKNTEVPESMQLTEKDIKTAFHVDNIE
jgi:hypothetical protein